MNMEKTSVSDEGLTFYTCLDIGQLKKGKVVAPRDDWMIGSLFSNCLESREAFFSHDLSFFRRLRLNGVIIDFHHVRPTWGQYDEGTEHNTLVMHLYFDSQEKLHQDLHP